MNGLTESGPTSAVVTSHLSKEFSIMRQTPLPPTVIDPPAVRTAAPGITAFAAELPAQLRAEKGNAILSPYSISTVLAMAALGARGTTLEQMQKALHLPPAHKLALAYGGLTTSVAPAEETRNRSELVV